MRSRILIGPGGRATTITDPADVAAMDAFDVEERRLSLELEQLAERRQAHAQDAVRRARQVLARQG